MEIYFTFDWDRAVPFFFADLIVCVGIWVLYKAWAERHSTIEKGPVSEAFLNADPPIRHVETDTSRDGNPSPELPDELHTVTKTLRPARTTRDQNHDPRPPTAPWQP